MPTATPPPSKPATQTVSFVLSVILFGLAIIPALKATAFIAHLFLAVIRSRVKDVRGDVTDVVEGYEAECGTDGSISRRVRMSCDK